MDQPGSSRSDRSEHGAACTAFAARYLARIVALILFSLAMPVLAETSFAERIEIGTSAQTWVLKKTGQTLREVFFFDVYDIAHYVDEAALTRHSSDHILTKTFTKQIRIVYLRNIAKKRVKAVLKEGFESNASDQELHDMSGHLNDFLANIDKDIEIGDELIIRWMESNDLVFIANGNEVFHVNSAVFARIMWSIWLGEKSVVSREDLLQDWPTLAQDSLN